jgi:G3E family GTPase
MRQERTGQHPVDKRTLLHACNRMVEGACGEQGVHMIFDGDFTEPWGPDETRESRFCFIGKNLDREQVLHCTAMFRSDRCC